MVKCRLLRSDVCSINKKMTLCTFLSFLLLFIFVGLLQPGFAAAPIVASGDETRNLGDNYTVDLSNGPYGSDAVTAKNTSKIIFGSNGKVVISNDAKSGVLASGVGSEITFGDNADVSAGGTGTRAVYTSAENSNVTFGTDAKISASGSNAYAVYAHSVGKPNTTIYLAERARVEATGSYANGLYATGLITKNVSYGLGAKIEAGDNLFVEAGGTWSRAVFAEWGGEIVLGNGAVLRANGEGGYGVDASGPASFKAGHSLDITVSGYGGINAVGRPNNPTTNVDIGDDASITVNRFGTSTVAGIGVQASNNAQVNFGNNATIVSTHGSGVFASGTAQSIGHVGFKDNAKIIAAGTGVSTTYGGSVLLGNNAVIMTSGDRANAMDTYSGGASIRAGNAAVVTTLGNESHALHAFFNSDITLGDDAVLRTAGDGAHGAHVLYSGAITIGSSADILTTGAESHAVYGRGAASIAISIDKNARIAAKGDAANAVYASGGQITIGENAYLETNGARTSTVTARDDQSKVTVGSGATILAASKDSYAVSAIYNGEVELVGDMTIASLYDRDAIALFADGKNTGGDVNARNASIHADGKLDILGGIVAGDYSSIDLTYLDGSSLVGFTQVSANDSTIAMDMSASTWDMTKSSSLTSLTVNDSTQVKYGDFDNPAGGNFMTLTTKTLNGNDGRFLMRTDIVNETADRIIVENASSGSHAITVVNIGGAATTGKERTTLVETADKGADFTLTNSKVDLGAFSYYLRNNNDGKGEFDAAGGQYWELYSQGGGSTPDDSSNTGSDAVNTFIGSYYLGYADTDTLMKRVGDLRNNTYQHGAWFRAYGGKFESDARQYVKDFDQDYWAVQVGYDNKLDRNRSWFKKGDTYVGAYIGLGNSDLDFTSGGSGEIEQHTMGMYWTYIGDSGFYFDAVAKYVWGENKFHSFDSAKDFVDGGEINSSGAGLSFETGKRFRFNKNDKGSWYVEPQLQLSWQHMSGGTFHASNGLNIGVSGWDSLIGRVGVLLGYETGRTNFYAKASYLKEFDGDMNIHANGVNISESLEDKWWVYGIGLTHQLNARNALYLDFERASGGDFTQKWQINAGWRISF